MISAIINGTIKEKEFPPMEEDSHLFLIRVIEKRLIKIIDTLNIRKMSQESRGNDNKKHFPGRENVFYKL